MHTQAHLGPSCGLSFSCKEQIKKNTNNNLINKKQFVNCGWSFDDKTDINTHCAASVSVSGLKTS